MKSFDAIEINDCTWQPHSDDYYRGYEAGQQSKQAEVDELQKRVDGLKAFCIKGVESNMLSIEYNQALIDMYKILKGDQS